VSARAEQDDVDAMLDDLRRGTDYATQAGLLKGDPAEIKEIFDVLAAGKDADAFRIAQTVNRVAQLIAPLTFADLPGLHRRVRPMQATLAILALIALALIGFFMHALRIEQAAIAEVRHIADLKIDTKLIELRDLAQYDQPIPRHNALYEEVQRRISELRGINDELDLAYNDIAAASKIPLFPTYSYFFVKTETVTCAAYESGCSKPELSQDPKPGVALDAGAPSSDKVVQVASPVNEASPGANGDTNDGECMEDRDGGIKVPKLALSYPLWMQRVLSETSSDYCFQLRVLFPANGSLLSQSVTHLSSAAYPVESKAALRLEWFLPFLYGVLGSCLFLMRNMTSSRTATLDWVALAMRLSLGGVAGIVIGWFGATAAAGFQPVGNLSVPFALAFLAGYTIELLFTVLDRLNKAVAGPKGGGT
jgi:hypothetical protein